MSFFKHIIFIVILVCCSSVYAEPTVSKSETKNTKRVYLNSNLPSVVKSTQVTPKKKLAKSTKSKKTKVSKAIKKAVIVAKKKPTTKVAKANNTSKSARIKTARINKNARANIYDPTPLPISPDSIIEYDNKNRVASPYALTHVGPFKNKEGSRFYEILPSGEKVVLTIDGRMQAEAENLLASYNLPYASLVAIEPDTGRIKALVGSSAQEGNGQTLVARSSFPAASLFKMITAAAAVETVGVTSDTPINYRGGTYSLGKHNYLPNAKSDKFVMTIGAAMGKSCNPVFARVALNYLSPSLLRKYASNFGFGQQLAYDFPLRGSSISLSNDQYEFARTAAGFGDAFISPVHAASIVAAIGNRGVMMRPYLVEGLVVGSNKIKLLDNMRVLDQSISPTTADEILTMMEATVKTGTARKHFRIASPSLRQISVAAKTGTLSGPNPKGVYHWFTAVAPVDNPKIAVSAMVIDNGSARINGAGLGRRFLEKIFDERAAVESAKDTSRSKGKPVS